MKQSSISSSVLPLFIFSVLKVLLSLIRRVAISESAVLCLQNNPLVFSKPYQILVSGKLEIFDNIVFHVKTNITFLLKYRCKRNLACKPEWLMAPGTARGTGTTQAAPAINKLLFPPLQKVVIGHNILTTVLHWCCYLGDTVLLAAHRHMYSSSKRQE